MIASAPFPVASLRILSDIHYGDRSSHVKQLGQLAPLLQGVDALVLNGATMDTRPGPYPELTAKQTKEVDQFFGGLGIPVTLITGNHDPFISGHHLLALEDGKIFLTHGDLLFKDVVPWSRDRARVDAMIQHGLRRFPDPAALSLEEQLLVYRKVASELPQRHQSEPNPIRHLLQFLQDTVWPPNRAFEILRAWRDMPSLGAALALKHRPQARFALFGHTHRPGVWKQTDGRIVINTGSFATPLGGLAVDVDGNSLSVLKVRRKGPHFVPGEVLHRFSLA